jgi:hypothetical protein
MGAGQARYARAYNSYFHVVFPLAEDVVTVEAGAPLNVMYW